MVPEIRATNRASWSDVIFKTPSTSDTRSKRTMSIVVDVALVRPVAEKVIEWELPSVDPVMLRSPKDDVPDAFVATGVVPFKVPGVPLSAAFTDMPEALTKLF